MNRIRKGASGFSMLELIVVVGVLLVVTTVAVPNMMTVLARMRMRSSMTSLSGVMQNSRMIAIKQNTTQTTCFGNEGNGLMAYVKPATASCSLTETDAQVLLQAPIAKYTAPTGAGAPAAMTSTQLGFTADTDSLSFNSRGMPCEYSAGTCVSKGFAYYFKDTSQDSGDGWAAISISPAGRISRWFWVSDTWVNN